MDPRMIELLESLDPNTYLEVSIRTRSHRNLLGSVSTTFMSPQNTVEQDVKEGARNVKFLRDLADELERQANPEDIQAVKLEFGDDA